MNADNDTDDDPDRDTDAGGGESDGRLLAATVAGDAEAFGRFYRRHERQVLGYAIAHCANVSDVADLVGETFLAALRAAPRFIDRDGDATAWLFGIARHVLAHQRRAFTRRQRLATRRRRYRVSHLTKPWLSTQRSTRPASHLSWPPP